MNPQEAISKLRRLRESIKDLGATPYTSKFAVWERKVKVALEKIYGTHSTEAEGFKSLDLPNSGGVKLYSGTGSSVVLGHGRTGLGLGEAATMLDSFIAEIEEFGMPEISNQSPTHLMKSNNSKAIENLRKLLQGAPESGTFNPEFERWSRNVETALIKIFGNQSREHRDYIHIPKAWVETGMPGSETRIALDYQRCVSSLKALLSASIDQIEEYGLEEDSTGVYTAETPIVTTSPESNKVFVIHGHDGGAKEEVARFLGRIGTEPIILHEQANEGQTIIEKFEKNSEVGFAVALLTPDDVGGVNTTSLQGRARQNVILELGFFMGKIGRKRTLAIVKEGVEKPSDYDGVAYTSYDNGQWKADLVRELKAAGLDVDSNGMF